MAKGETMVRRAVRQRHICILHGTTSKSGDRSCSMVVAGVKVVRSRSSVVPLGARERANQRIGTFPSRASPTDGLYPARMTFLFHLSSHHCQEYFISLGS